MLGGLDLALDVGKSQMEDVWIIDVDDLQFHFPGIGVDVSF
jgi:hypothetical protein